MSLTVSDAGFKLGCSNIHGPTPYHRMLSVAPRTALPHAIVTSRWLQYVQMVDVFGNPLVMHQPHDSGTKLPLVLQGQSSRASMVLSLLHLDPFMMHSHLYRSLSLQVSASYNQASRSLELHIMESRSLLFQAFQLVSNWSDANPATQVTSNTLHQPLSSWSRSLVHLTLNQLLWIELHLQSHCRSGESYHAFLILLSFHSSTDNQQA